jgi:hypothetical protein
MGVGTGGCRLTGRSQKLAEFDELLLGHTGGELREDRGLFILDERADAGDEIVDHGQPGGAVEAVPIEVAGGAGDTAVLFEEVLVTAVTVGEPLSYDREEMLALDRFVHGDDPHRLVHDTPIGPPALAELV